MKKVIFIIVATTLLTSSLCSQTFSIVSGWQNLGAINDINVIKTFSNNCIDMVWKYDDISNSWSAYSPNSSIKNIINNSNNINLLTKIDSGSGFWIKANSSCNLSNDTTDNNTTDNTKINIVSNWQNLAAKSDINVSNIFNKSFIDIVWRYDNNSNSWSAYSPKSSIQSLIDDNNISSLNTISKGLGFWLKASSKCTINTNKTVEDNPSYEPIYDPIKQKTLFPGHYPGMWANEYAFAAVKKDGSVVSWGNVYYGGDSSSVADRLTSGVKFIYFNDKAFAALKNDGSVATWGYSYDGETTSPSDRLSSGVKVVYSTKNAFAALKDNGSVVTWGTNLDGGDSKIYDIKRNIVGDVTDKLSSGIKAIYSTSGAFAALKNDGSVVTWGYGYNGGDGKVYETNGSIIGDVTDRLRSDVKAIYSTSGAFAALKNDGSVVTWGNKNGGNSSGVTNQLKNGVKLIYSNNYAFAALKNDGSVVTWGYGIDGGDSSSVANKLKCGVKTIYSTLDAFAALKNDGSVVTWGNGYGGGDSSSVADKLNSKVKAIYSTGWAFAALKNDGSVVTWGDNYYGGNSSNVADKLSSKVKAIYSDAGAFAALKNDGSVVTWGNKHYGGDGKIYDISKNLIGDVTDKLKSKVKAIYSNKHSFAALKEDGSVVAWGTSEEGGDSSNVSDQLNIGVEFIAPSYTN